MCISPLSLLRATMRIMNGRTLVWIMLGGSLLLVLFYQAVNQLSQ